jgi:hypothetical protein
MTRRQARLDRFTVCTTLDGWSGVHRETHGNDERLRRAAATKEIGPKLVRCVGRAGQA